jgi:hypothetical protein
MMRALLWLACFAVAGTASAAEVGRLFFTPTERAQLDVARTQKKAPAATDTATAAAEEETPAPQVVTYGGLVRRSDGKSMLWLNDRLLEEKEALTGSALQGQVRPDGAVTLRAPQSGANVEIKVGQSVELLSGKVAEGRNVEAPVKRAPKKSDESASPKREVSETKGVSADSTQAATSGTSQSASARASTPVDKSRDSLIGVK